VLGRHHAASARRGRKIQDCELGSSATEHNREAESQNERLFTLVLGRADEIASISQHDLLAF
jgi:hypothetical protein